jgi:hypothetical protein
VSSHCAWRRARFDSRYAAVVSITVRDAARRRFTNTIAHVIRFLVMQRRTMSRHAATSPPQRRRTQSEWALAIK